MSALPPKADILSLLPKCLLMTQSGHSLDELVEFSRSSVELNAHIIKFLNLRPCFGSLETDKAATMLTGHRVTRYIPSDCLLGFLSALRAGNLEAGKFVSELGHASNSLEGIMP